MQLSIKTSVLKEMTTRATKGVGNNKLIPLTGFLCLQASDGMLTMMSTDGSNYLMIRREADCAERFYVAAPADVFSKLIARMTCEEINLQVTDDGKALKVKGSGNYTIELPVESEGEPIVYPNPFIDLKQKKGSASLSLETVKRILGSVKPSLAVSDESCYAGYYIRDKIIATDACKLACLDVPVVEDPILVAADTMDLLAGVTSKTVDMELWDDAVVFRSADCWIYGVLIPGVEYYDVESASAPIKGPFKGVCKLPRISVLQVLDRIALFVGTYDRNGIRLDFKENEVVFSSKTYSGSEAVAYTEKCDGAEYSCLIDIEFLMSQIKAQSCDVITLYYGESVSIKMVDGNLTQLVALMQEH